MCEETNLIEDNIFLTKKEIMIAIFFGILALAIYTVVIVFFYSACFKNNTIQNKPVTVNKTINKIHDISWYIQKRNEIIKLTDEAALIHHTNIINNTDNVGTVTFNGETQYIINTDKVKPDPKMKDIMNTRLKLINEYNVSMGCEDIMYINSDNMKDSGLPLKMEYILDFDSWGDIK